MNRWWPRKVSALSLSQKVRSWLRDQRTINICYSVPHKIKHFRFSLNKKIDAIELFSFFLNKIICTNLLTFVKI